MNGVTAVQACMFVAGCLCAFAGVWLITTGRRILQKGEFEVLDPEEKVERLTQQVDRSIVPVDGAFGGVHMFRMSDMMHNPDKKEELADYVEYAHHRPMLRERTADGDMTDVDALGGRAGMRRRSSASRTQSKSLGDASTKLPPVSEMQPITQASPHLSLAALEAALEAALAAALSREFARVLGAQGAAAAGFSIAEISVEVSLAAADGGAGSRLLLHHRAPAAAHQITGNSGTDADGGWTCSYAPDRGADGSVDGRPRPLEISIAGSSGEAKGRSPPGGGRSSPAAAPGTFTRTNSGASQSTASVAPAEDEPPAVYSPSKVKRTGSISRRESFDRGKKVG